MNAPQRTHSPSKPGGAPKKGSLQNSVSYVLTAMRHWRIACLMAIFACMLGLTYYVYAKSVYFSKSLVRFSLVDLPINEDTAKREVPYYVLERSMLGQLRSRHLIERTAKSMGLVGSTGTFGIIREELVQRIDISLLDSTTLAVDVYPYYPDLAREWTEAMIQEYRNYKMELRLAYREAALATYNKELDEIQMRIDEVREEKFQVEQETKIIELGNEYERLKSDLRDLFLIEDRLEAAERAIESITQENLTPVEKLSRLAGYKNEIKVKERPEMMRKLLGTTPVEIKPLPLDDKVIVLDSMNRGSELWNGMETEIRNLKIQRAQESLQFGPEHKVIKDLNQRISLLESKISAECEAAIETFRAEFADLAFKKEQLERIKPRFDQVTKDYTEARQKYEVADKGQIPWNLAHAKVRSKIEALEHGAEKERIDVQYLGIETLRDDPVSPSKMKLVYMSITLALVLGLGVPFALEYFNNTAARIDDVENAYGITGLGIVPETNKYELENISRSPEIDATTPNSLMENFRVIRGGIAMNKDMDSQVVLITSAKPGEGKTSMTCNLSWAFASVGAKTLIIDSDLRRGRVHDVLGVSNEVGLSDVLMGKAPLEQAIQATQVPNLHVLTRGGIFPGATERLCTQQHERYIEQLRQKYDHILMDCPPVLGLSESSALTRVCDGVVFTIRAEFTNHRDIAAAIDLLKRGGARFFGFVLNRLDLSRLANYHKYFYYSSFYYDELVDSSSREKYMKDPARHG